MIKEFRIYLNGYILFCCIGIVVGGGIVLVIVHGEVEIGEICKENSQHSVNKSVFWDRKG